MSRAYKVSGKASLDTRSFKASVNDISTHLSKATRSWQKTLGDWSRSFRLSSDDLAVGIGSLWGFKEVMDMGGDLSDLSKQLGMSTNAISELGYAGKLSGIQLDSVVKGVQKMQKALGSGSGDKALKKLGLDPESLRNAAPDVAFTRIIDALRGIKNQAERMDLATEIFGKGGGEFLRLANEGAAGLNAMREEARQLGASISDIDAKKLDELGDKWDRLKTRADVTGINVRMKMAPSMSAGMDFMDTALSKVNDFVNKHPVAIQRIVNTTVAILGFNMGLKTLKFTMGEIIGLSRSLLAGFNKIIPLATKMFNWASKIPGAGLVGRVLGLPAAAYTGWQIGALAGRWIHKSGLSKEGAGWTKEPIRTWFGSQFGGWGRAFGNELGNFYGAMDEMKLGPRSRELMASGAIDSERNRVAGKSKLSDGASPTPAVDPENKRLMEEQNKLLKEQNEHLRRLANTPTGANIGLVPSY